MLPKGAVFWPLSKGRNRLRSVGEQQGSVWVPILAKLSDFGGSALDKAATSEDRFL